MPLEGVAQLREITRRNVRNHDKQQPGLLPRYRARCERRLAEECRRIFLAKHKDVRSPVKRIKSGCGSSPLTISMARSNAFVPVGFGGP